MKKVKDTRNRKEGWNNQREERTKNKWEEKNEMWRKKEGRWEEKKGKRMKKGRRWTKERKRMSEVRGERKEHGKRVHGDLSWGAAATRHLCCPNCGTGLPAGRWGTPPSPAPPGEPPHTDPLERPSPPPAPGTLGQEPSQSNRFIILYRQCKTIFIIVLGITHKFNQR